MTKTKIKILLTVLIILFLFSSLGCFSLAVWGREKALNKIKKIVLGIKKEEVEKESNFNITDALDGKSVIEKPSKITKKISKKEKKTVKKITLKSQPKSIEKPKPKTVSQSPLSVAPRGVYIDINLSQQKLILYNGSKILGIFPISSGAPATPTPVGQFKIINKLPMAYSLRFPGFECKMPYWLQFTWQGHGIHELPIMLKTGLREGTWMLGRPVSHGCVRLGVGAAKFVYDRVGVGTPVIIHY